MSDHHVDPAFLVAESASCPKCGAPADTMAEKIELQADRARLEQANANLGAEVERMKRMLFDTKQLAVLTELDRDRWHARADEAAATLRAYRMGAPDRKYALAMSAAVAQCLQEGIPVHLMIVGLCEAASIPMPRVPLTPERADALCRKIFMPNSTAENWAPSPWIIQAVIEASK